MPPHIQALTVSGLACRRGHRVLFRELSFAVRAGEVLALEGANGAGKTSLLRQIAGFLAVEMGGIAITSDTGDIADAEERGAFIGWLGHHDGLKPQMSPRENLAFYTGLYGTAGDIDAALGEVGLSRAADLPAQYLSAGQRRRAALARLILSHRSLWLMDEPLAALDAEGKALVNAALEAHRANGGIAIAATHEKLDAATATMRLGAA